MRIINKDQRVGVFIDIQNLYHSARNLYKDNRVNFRELLKETLADRKLIRAVGYVVKSETALGEDSFFEALNKIGIELRSKDLQIYPGGVKKADWDVGLTVDAIRMANSLDVVVIASGDGDFVPLVEYLKWGLGRQVAIAAFLKNTSSRLRESADYFINLEGIPKLIIKKDARAKNI